MTTDHATTFRKLHAGPGILFLANAWDAGSAKLIESLGAPAIATTSAGVAWSNGYSDGHALPVAALIATVQAIARVIQVPLTADVEGGYSDDPATVADNVSRVIDAGAVGINLEDSKNPPDLLCTKIEHIKRAAARNRVDVFINARTDVYLFGLVGPDAALEETLARGRRYRSAGADGLFVPGVIKPDEIKAVASTIDLPLNVLAWPGLPASADLRNLGVRRLSAGGAVARAAYDSARTFATAFLANGETLPAGENALTGGQLNQLFAAK